LNKIEEYLTNTKGIVGKMRPRKWKHYIEIYDRHFSRYIDKSPRVLEVGVKWGAGLELWKYYFGDGAEIYGVDTKDRRVRRYSRNVHFIKGDQGDPTFWRDFKKDLPKFDIIIDDGGHRIEQQITTFECMYDHIEDDGVYLCEDTHTSYWEEFGGGYKKDGTFYL